MSRMAVKKLVYYPQDEALLRQTSEPITRFKDKRTKRLIQDLKDTLESQPGAAIAAPQIGVFKRVTVVKFGQNEGDEEGPMVTLINPEIIETGEDEKGFDGCLSYPRVFTWDTPRPSWLIFRALDEDGNPFEKRVEDMDARVIHHEIDHLNGVLFMDRLTDPTALYTPIKDDEGNTKMIKLSDLPSLL